MALLDEGGGRRTASVIAESPVRVFGLTAWQFTPLLEQHPQIAVKVAKILARRLREAEERAGTGDLIASRATVLSGEIAVPCTGNPL